VPTAPFTGQTPEALVFARLSAISARTLSSTKKPLWLR
jgi:hypothetical protein